MLRQAATALAARVWAGGAAASPAATATRACAASVAPGWPGTDRHPPPPQAPLLLALTRAWSAAAAPGPPPPPHEPGTVTPLTSDAAADAAVRSSGAGAVLDFTAAWCGPCRAMRAPFAALAAAHPGVRFHTVDIDDPALEATVSAAGVSAVPTFTFHDGSGGLVGSVQGADLAAVTAAVERLVQRGGGE
jgi:thioredoxin 1